MKKYFFAPIVAFLLMLNSLNAQNGGMWIPSLVKDLNIGDMQEMGLELSADDLYDINKSSVKDAIVHFGGGCTGEIISNQGLLLTNHHCGYGEIQSHSTLENNYLRDGFWAKSQSEELANPGLTATFIIRIDDVTNKVIEGTNDNMSFEERQNIISQNINKVVSSTAREDYQDVKVKAFFNGNQYFAFVTETYNDVRLVGAPPSMIGKFGSDTDNWVWPRHTGDFSLFRVYASKDNKPADYSEENVPLKPRHFLPVSLDGVEEGDFTMVYGFPGRTQEYLPSVAIKQLEELINPHRINIREKALAVVDKEMRADEAIKIKYASKYARIANYWKKWIGENKGLDASNAVEKRRKYEDEFAERVNSNPVLASKYDNILRDFELQYFDYGKYDLATNYFNEVAYRNIELIRFSLLLNGVVEKYESNSENADEYFESVKPKLDNFAEGFYKNYEPRVDEKVFEVLIELYLNGIDKEFVPQYVAEQLKKNKNDYAKLSSKVYSKSMLTSKDGYEKLMSLKPAKIVAKLKKDPAYLIAKSMKDTYDAKVKPEYSRIKGEIALLQKDYMKAQMEAFPERKFYPDANSTLRITWGKVNGYEPKDGVYYEPKTFLDGIVEKHVPGDYEFNVPEKLLNIYENKDFGIYAEDGKIPVAFIATNHTTGGNSGSPALDANGNLIGLNFDRVWEGTMSDINYDAEICRNIMVDIKYVLFIIDKYGEARYLFDEMKLVRPKSELNPVTE